MVDAYVVKAKLTLIERRIARIEEVHGERRKKLQAVDVADITAFNLQRAVQAAIDLATHVVATEGYGTPETTGNAFSLLERQGVLDADLAGRLRRMVGLRNLMIYDYQAVHPAIVETIVKRHLGDLRALGARILDSFGLRQNG